MRHKLWLVIVILLLAAAGLFAFAATGHTYLRHCSRSSRRS